MGVRRIYPAVLIDQKALMKLFPRIFFSLFCIVFAVAITYSVFIFYSKRRHYTAMSFTATVIQIKELHGSSTDFFVHLSNGQSFLFTVPNKSIHLGDSVIKRKNEKYFTIKEKNGEFRYKIGINGRMVMPSY